MRCGSEEMSTALEGEYRRRQEGTGHRHHLQPIHPNVIGTETVPQLLDEPLPAISEAPLIRFRGPRTVLGSELDAHRTPTGPPQIHET